MRLRRIAALLLIVLMLVSLSACGTAKNFISGEEAGKKMTMEEAREDYFDAADVFLNNPSMKSYANFAGGTSFSAELYAYWCAYLDLQGHSESDITEFFQNKLSEGEGYSSIRQSEYRNANDDEMEEIQNYLDMFYQYCKQMLQTLNDHPEKFEGNDTSEAAEKLEQLISKIEDAEIEDAVVMVADGEDGEYVTSFVVLLENGTGYSDFLFRFPIGTGSANALI